MCAYNVFFYSSYVIDFGEGRVSTLCAALINGTFHELRCIVGGILPCISLLVAGR
jgi:hypothetical protein